MRHLISLRTQAVKSNGELPTGAKDKIEIALTACEKVLSATGGNISALRNVPAQTSTVSEALAAAVKHKDGLRKASTCLEDVKLPSQTPEGKPATCDWLVKELHVVDTTLDVANRHSQLCIGITKGAAAQREKGAQPEVRASVAHRLVRGVVDSLAVGS